MPSHNRGEISTALAQFFGIKGAFATTVEQPILPVVSVGDITEAPYLRYGIPVSRSIGSGTPAAGEFGVVGARPGPFVALQILQIILQNDSNAPIDYGCRLLTGTNVTTAGLTRQSQFVDMSGPEAGVLRPSEVWNGSHTSGIGTTHQLLTVPADSTLIWTLPLPGFVLYGNDPGGRAMLALWGETADVVLPRVGFVGKEWPLPG